jgi:hypothetical protein
MMNPYSFDENLFRLFKAKPDKEAIPEKPTENKDPDSESNSDINKNEGISDKTIDHTK